MTSITITTFFLEYLQECCSVSLGKVEKPGDIYDGMSAEEDTGSMVLEGNCGGVTCPMDGQKTMMMIKRFAANMNEFTWFNSFHHERKLGVNYPGKFLLWLPFNTNHF